MTDFVSGIFLGTCIALTASRTQSRKAKYEYSYPITQNDNEKETYDEVKRVCLC